MFLLESCWFCPSPTLHGLAFSIENRFPLYVHVLDIALNTSCEGQSSPFVALLCLKVKSLEA